MAGGRDESRKAQARGQARGAASGAITISTADGEELTVSELITRLDETGRRRLENMNRKLRDLEIQMEALETEMNKANECF